MSSLKCRRENSTYQIALEREASKVAVIQARSGEMTLARRVSARSNGSSNLSRGAATRLLFRLSSRSLQRSRL